MKSLLSRGKLITAGATLAALLLLIGVIWQQANPRPGQLPTFEELSAPSAKPGASGPQNLSDEQRKALQEGRPVRIDVPGGGGGLFILNPSKTPDPTKGPTPTAKHAEELRRALQAGTPKGGTK
jgi:hypothetical protein